MSISVEWDNPEHTMIRYTFIGGWTWNELYHSIDVGEQMSRGATVRVHAILDVRQGAMLPGGSFMNKQSRDHAQNLVNRSQPDRGAIVIVGANLLLRSMYGMFRNLFGSQAAGVHFADTVREARALLIEQYIALPD